MHAVARSVRCSVPRFLVTGSLALPLVWGACSEPPPATTPSVSLEERPGGRASGEPAGDDSSPAPGKPRPATAGQGLDRATMKAIDDQLARLPPAKNAHLGFAECNAMFGPTQAAVNLALHAADACKSDSDCVSASDGTCMTGVCGAAVAKQHKEGFDAAIEHIAHVACPAWKAGDCETTNPLPIPSCAPPNPRCEKGRCTP